MGKNNHKQTLQKLKPNIMKITKQIITSILFLFLFQITNAQESFQPGWYIIQSGASYSVLQASGADFYYDDDFNIISPDITTLPMAENEAVLVFSFSKDKYYSFDPNGRIVVFQGASSLIKAPVSPTGVVTLNEDITLPGGEDVLSSGAYYWCANEDDESFTLQLAGNKTYKIKKGKTAEGIDKVEYHTGTLKRLAKSESYRRVDE